MGVHRTAAHGVEHGPQRRHFLGVLRPPERHISTLRPRFARASGAPVPVLGRHGATCFTGVGRRGSPELRLHGSARFPLASSSVQPWGLSRFALASDGVADTLRTRFNHACSLLGPRKSRLSIGALSGRGAFYGVAFVAYLYASSTLRLARLRAGLTSFTRASLSHYYSPSHGIWNTARESMEGGVPPSGRASPSG